MHDNIITELSQLQQGIVKIVCSESKKGVQKATIKPVVLKGEKKWQLEKIVNNQAFHENIEHGELNSRVISLLEEASFRQVNMILDGRTVSYRISKKKKLFRSESVSKKVDSVAMDHNREKATILEEGMPILPLVDLGVFDKEFRVKKSMNSKFRQINRFVEIIADEFKHCTKSELRILDFGCGKSYLTFIIYYYFKFIREIPVHIVGYDLKEEVVAHCNAVAEKYQYNSLEFVLGDVSRLDTSQKHVDAMITLHACDTATDYALDFAVKNHIDFIFSVPCCQHEVNAQITAQDEFSVLLHHGLYKERFSAILTDAIRCEVLRDMGYDVDVIEFVDLENTPKNSMIRAKRTSRKPSCTLNGKIQAILDKFGIDPTIVKLSYHSEFSVEVGALPSAHTDKK